MTNLMEAFERNALTIEAEEKEQKVLKKEEATARDQKHLEMASKWLMRKTNESRFYPSSGLGECEISENMKAIARDWQHLELAYEWLRSRGEIIPSFH
jgi:ssDNA-binding Zn-finger/Zn-ribbon topoisomerase 1